MKMIILDVKCLLLFFEMFVVEVVLVRDQVVVEIVGGKDVFVMISCELIVGVDEILSFDIGLIVVKVLVDFF